MSLKKSILILSLPIFFTACGGGDKTKTQDVVSNESTVTEQTPKPTSPPASSPNPNPSPAPSNPVVSINNNCLPSTGIDYQVGPGKAYTALEQVPWENLKSGDTVRIFYKDSSYKGKFMIAAQATNQQPVRICGVKGPNGERPEIDGQGAVSRVELDKLYGSSDSVSAIHQERSMIVVKQLASQNWTDYPANIQIDGLAIRRGHPNYTFTDTKGLTKNYAAFGACIWIERGLNITIKDNEISDCQMAIFTKSTDEGDFAQSRNILIKENNMWGHGISGSYLEHTTYTQGIGMTIEGNVYGPLRSGALGNSVKDRSIKTVIRYNKIENGAHSLDLVEAEDFPVTAANNPDYRKTYVYGNLLLNNSGSRAIVHYGGDHFGSTPGANWGEDLFRKGNLYFYNNTVIGTGKIRLFRVSTTDETVHAWNNILWSDTGVDIRTLENDTVGSSWTPNGPIYIDNNFLRAAYGGNTLRVFDTNTISGSTSAVDINFKPITQNVINKSIIKTESNQFDVNKEISSSGQLTNKVIKDILDLGAIESR